MRKTSISLDGTRIAYDVHGSGSRAIVLVHGWMMSGAVFAELLATWQPAGARVIVPDLRGSGDSETGKSGYALERYREDVLAVLDAERATRTVIIGHSMGGQVAQLVAATSPERVAGLVGVLPVPARGLPLPDDARGFFRGAGGDGQALGRILDMASPALDRTVHARLTAEALRVAPRCVAEAFDAWTAGGFEPRLTSVRAPALIVGSDDPFLPPDLLRQSVAAKLSGARFVKFDGAGHYLPNEQPRALSTVLEAFLAGLGDDPRD